MPRTNDLSSTEIEINDEKRNELKLLLKEEKNEKIILNKKEELLTTTKILNNNLTENLREYYVVIRVIPLNDVHLKLLEKLEINGADMELNFWTSPVRIKSGVDIMLPKNKLSLLQRYLQKNRINFNIIINDVENLIIQRERKNKNILIRKHRRRLADEPINNREINKIEEEIDFYNYNSYSQMVAWMKSLAKQNPKFVQFISIGKSHEGRGIEGLEIGSRGFRKRAFWIDGGIHAREWAAPHTALYFINQLVSRYGKDEEITRLANEITWIIVPLLNPDGYEFTRSSTNPNIRLWRKNRSPTHCVRDQWGRNRCCKGVDLNRNFDFHFKESGSSDDPCSEIYQGKHAFSEPEARAVRDALLSNRYRGRIDGYITLHTYSQIWIHPYGHKRDSYPGDVQDLFSVGQRAATALSSLYGTKYVVGSGADTLYPASGGSEDWAKESANIKYVYLLELRPDEKNWDGFILDERQLMPTATETWAGVRVVAEAIIQRANRARRVAINNNGIGNFSTKIGVAGVRQFILTDKTTNNTPIITETKNLKLSSVNELEIKKEKNELEEEQKNIKICFDRRRACRRWVKQSEHLCQSVSIFMTDQCARSCGFC
ncbi:hypothetical protein ACQ4LE_006595 [Meloidogyne hapla]